MNTPETAACRAVVISRCTSRLAVSDEEVARPRDGTLHLLTV